MESAQQVEHPTFEQEWEAVPEIDDTTFTDTFIPYSSFYNEIEVVTISQNLCRM